MEVVVKGYNLGVWVEPDLTEAIKAGLQLWLNREYRLIGNAISPTVPGLKMPDAL